jgi:hypothetical protein
MESIEQTFTGNINYGRKISCTIDRNGDLVSKMILEVDIEHGEHHSIHVDPVALPDEDLVIHLDEPLHGKTNHVSYKLSLGDFEIVRDKTVEAKLKRNEAVVGAGKFWATVQTSSPSFRVLSQIVGKQSVFGREPTSISTGIDFNDLVALLKVKSSSDNGLKLVITYIDKDGNHVENADGTAIEVPVIIGPQSSLARIEWPEELEINAKFIDNCKKGCHPLGPCVAPNETLAAKVHRLGHALVKEVEVEIGGQIMDTQYGEWLEIWSQLTCTEDELTTLRTMISGSIRSSSCQNSFKMYIPLQFWFNRNPGLALPLIALQYHEVKINLYVQELCNLNLTKYDKINQISLYCDYIFLDTDERRRFAQVSHEYLIDQVQFNNIHSVCKDETNANIDLRFNHPCKELIWVVQPREEGLTSGHAATPFRYSNLFNIQNNTSYDTTLWRYVLYINGYKTGATVGDIISIPTAVNDATGDNPPGPTESVENELQEIENQHPGKSVTAEVEKIRGGPRQLCVGLTCDGLAIAGTRQVEQLDTLLSAKLQLNGNDRFSEREATYFRCVQPYQFHTGGHRQGNISLAGSNQLENQGGDWVSNVNPDSGVHGEDGFIYVYSFGLKPEEHQPSGTCNFSRIDNATLQMKLNLRQDIINHSKQIHSVEEDEFSQPEVLVPGDNVYDRCGSVVAPRVTHNHNNDKFIKVYATNYNVLRIMSGMGGLAYSN